MAKIRVVNVTEVVHQPLLLLQVEAVPVVESLNTAVTKLSDENVLETAEKIDFIKHYWYIQDLATDRNEYSFTGLEPVIGKFKKREMNYLSKINYYNHLLPLAIIVFCFSHHKKIVGIWKRTNLDPWTSLEVPSRS